MITVQLFFCPVLRSLGESPVSLFSVIINDMINCFSGGLRGLFGIYLEVCYLRE